jgi:hypothetical protein
VTRRASRRRGAARLSITAMGSLLGIIVMTAHVAPVTAEPEPGGLNGNALWVHARLGQPRGNRPAGGPKTGWALRYIMGDPANLCIVSPRNPADANNPWFGSDENSVPVEVLLVNRANPSQLQFQGEGCLEPADLVQTPTQAEIMEALDLEQIQQPQVNSSPGARGLTGMESWFWTPTDGDAQVDISLRGFTISASAQARYHWSTGDDGSYETGRGGSPQNPAVRHVYNSKSPGTGYNVTLDMIWEGEYNWFGFGDAGAGQLGPVTRSGTRSYPVNEVRSVLQ